jgi:ACS family tartrate transporter-like MFS transporter
MTRVAAPEDDLTASSPPTPGNPPQGDVEAATMRRINRRLVPLLLLLYVVCFIDRTNVGIAALQMNRDLGFSAAVYGLGSGIFFLGYALFEVPSNLVLARVGARWWIGRIAVTWGLLTVAMMFVRTPESFYVLRFLLGVAEAGYFPGVVYYMSHWFPERYRARSLSRFVIGVPLAGAIGGAAGTSLLGLDGVSGIAGWQWLFLVEGIPAVILGVLAIRVLTDRPADAGWLTPEQRRWLGERVGREGSEAARHAAASLRAVLAAPGFWRIALMYFAYALPSYSIALWLPTILRETGGLATQEIGAAISAMGVASVVVILLNGAHSDRTGERAWHAAVPCVVGAAGLAAAAWVGPVGAVVGLGVAFVGLTAYLPLFWSVPASTMRGPAAAGAIALLNSIGILGGFVGPSGVGVVREATGSFNLVLLVFAVLTVLVAVATVVLLGGTRRRAASAVISRPERLAAPALSEGR